MKTVPETALPVALSGYRDVLDDQFVAYLGYEHAAARLLSFQPHVIPGLLQTRRYADRLIRAVAPPGTSEETLTRQLEARLARQAILEADDGPEVFFLLDEAALRRQTDPGPAGQQVIREQLAHLRQVAARPSVTIMVLPLDRSISHGLRGGFVALELPAPPRTMVYLEGTRDSSTLTDAHEQVRFHAELFTTLAERCVHLDDALT